MANIPSPIYQSTTNTKDLYYKPTGGDYTKIADPNALQSLAKQGLVEVGKQYQSYTPPSVNVSADVKSAPSGNVKNLETSPGVLSSSALTDFYKNQISTQRADAEAAMAAQKALADQINALKAPDYQTTYNASLNEKVAPLDTQITGISTKVNTIDSALRTMEDDIRAELGGRAPESYVQAQLAARSKPLLLQRQGLVDQYTTLNSQRQSALSNIQTGLDLQEKQYNANLGLLEKKSSLYNTAITAYQNLLEKGSTASNTEKDNFRQLFNTLLTQAPDALKNLTTEEMAQLQQGNLPASVMQKIGTTINEQKLATQNADKKATPAQILNRAAQIQQLASDNGEYMDTQVAINQAVTEYKSLGMAVPENLSSAAPTTPVSTGTEGTIANRTNNPGNIKWGSFAKSMGAVDSGIKASDGGTFAMFPSVDAGAQAQVSLLKTPAYQNLTLDQAMKRWSNSGYGAEIAPNIPSGTKMNSLTSDQLTYLQKQMQKSEGFVEKNKFTPEFYKTKLGQKTLDNEAQARAKFESNPIVKDFNVVQSNFASMKDIVDAGVGGPGDLAIVYQFMKALDPNSVVRETEFDAAAKSGNIFNGIWAKFNGYFKDSGGFLPPAVKQSFVDIIGRTLKSKASQYNNYVDQTKQIAQNQGMNPENVATSFDISNVDTTLKSSVKSDPLGLGVTIGSDPLGLFK